MCPYLATAELRRQRQRDSSTAQLFCLDTSSLCNPVKVCDLMLLHSDKHRRHIAACTICCKGSQTLLGTAAVMTSQIGRTIKLKNTCMACHLHGIACACVEAIALSDPSGWKCFLCTAERFHHWRWGYSQVLRPSH